MLEAFADFITNVQIISLESAVTQLAADLELYAIADILASF